MGEKRKPIEMAPGLFGEEVPVGKVRSKAHKHEKYKNPLDNPMVQLHGQHPDPMLRCKDCNHLYDIDYSKKRFKCIKRVIVGDEVRHQKHFCACKLFEVYDSSKSHNIVPVG